MAKSKIGVTLAEMSMSDIKALSAKQAKAMVREARKLVAERVEKLSKASFTKSGAESKTFYSAAYENLTEWTESHFGVRSTAPSKLKRVEATAELQAYKKFFQSKSSTVRGAREVMRQQDVRIFGEGKNGRPLQTMTRQQRENFWSLYDEFFTGSTTAELAYKNYSNIQQEIGKIIKERRRDEKGRFVGFDLGDAMTELSRRLQDDYDTSKNDLFSGKWSDT